jgi:arylsulfatase A-like enzyme
VALAAGLVWLLLLISYLRLSPSLYFLLDHATFRTYSFRHRTALVALTLLAAFATQSFLRDRPFWNTNEPLEIARSAHRPFISQFPSIGDSARQARETEAVSKYLAANPKLKTARPLVLITVDALRADQMGVYGGPRDNTPFLSTLVKQNRMQPLGPIYSNSTWSYPALIGVLSSKYPGQFTPQPWNLADVLRQLGYVNYCFFSGDHIHFGDLRWMLGPSIDVYRDGASEDARYPNDDRLLGEWVAKENWPHDRPVFLFLHLMSVHALGALQPEFMRWEKDSDRATSNHEAMRDRYQDRILQADARLEQLLALLDGNQAFKNALIIITADHGEFLGEFGYTSHGQEPYEAVIRIPLLIVDPLHGVYRKRPLSSLIDIAPTFLEAIGARSPPNWQGIALQKDVERNVIVVESTSVFSVVGVFGGRRYKYFHWRKSGAESLFDLDSTEGKEEFDLLTHPAAIMAKSDLAALSEMRAIARGMLSK